MKGLVNLKDLMIEQMRELYKAEKHQQWALKNFLKKVSSENLKGTIKSCIRNSEKQEKSLIKVFNLLNEKPDGEKSRIMDCITEQGEKLISRGKDPEIIDALTIENIQQINHYKIATYGSALAYAKVFEYDEIINLLSKSVETEKATDQEMTRLAMEEINAKAKAPIIS